MIAKKTMFRASVWVFAGYGSSQVLRLISNLIMTRLLIPEDFGLMAIGIVIFTGISLLSDIGIGPSIIQNKRGRETGFLNTAWTMQIIRGIVIWIIICLIAVFIWLTSSASIAPSDTVYNHPDLPLLICLIGFTSVVSGMQSTALFTNARSLYLGRITSIEIVTQIVAICSTVTWALLDASVWALVFGMLISISLKTMLSHFALKGIRHRLEFDASSFWELFHFGKWIFLATMTSYLANQGSAFLFAYYISASEMGLYAIAVLLCGVPLTLVSKYSHSVLFPTYSRIFRDSPEKALAFSIRTRSILLVICMPIVAFLIVFSEDIVRILYDDRYTDVAGIMQILLFSVAIGIQIIPSSILLLAKGEPKYATMSELLKGFVIFTILPVAYNYYGLQGMLYVVAISSVISAVFIWTVLAIKKLLSIKTELFGVAIFVTSYIVFKVINDVFF